MGFGPTADPQYVVVCVIDQAGFGATAAAPVVGRSSTTWPPTRSPPRGSPPSGASCRRPRRCPSPARPRPPPRPPPTAPAAGTGPSTTATTAPARRLRPPRSGPRRPAGPRMSGEMQSLWPRVEPLLAQVTKPARYIGGELGAQVTEHADSAVSWLLIYPDTYEIGLPNQGLQILYEILNERDDAVAERAYAPWVDMEAAMRAAGVPLFSLENHLAGRVLRRTGLQPLRRTGLHQRPQSDRSGRRPGPRRRPHPRPPGRGGRGPLRLQPRAPGRLRRLLRPG